MKTRDFKFSLRLVVTVFFIILFVSVLLTVNAYFNSSQKKIDRLFEESRPNYKLPKMTFETHEDSLYMNKYIKANNQIVGAIKNFQFKTRFYSSLLLFSIMVISIILFSVFFYYITKPLNELQEATLKIEKGDYSVYLPDSGIYEMRKLKQSFNSMSRELEKTQRKLVLAEKEMIWKEMSRILAHEIKNPLTPIQLSTQRLERFFHSDREKFDAIFNESVEIINSEIMNLRNLVQTFSGFAKISDAAKSIFNPTEVITDIIKPYTSAYNIKMELPENHRIEFDRLHFYQIITNIVQNAIDVSGEKDIITVSMEQSRSYLIISIKDEGPGIADEDMKNIFEPYFTKKKKGTGLGLALVKRLVEANNAIIRVKSELSKGSVFELIIEDFRA